MEKFGDKIRKLREESNLPLRKLSALLDVDQSTLSKIERGERKAKREQVIQLATLLNTSTDELLTFWLADQIYELVKNEKVAKNSLTIIINELI